MHPCAGADIHRGAYTYRERLLVVERVGSCHRAWMGSEVAVAVEECASQCGLSFVDLRRRVIEVARRAGAIQNFPWIRSSRASLGPAPNLPILWRLHLLCRAIRRI